VTFNLKILGSASALPTKNRFTTAQVLNVHERFFLIDCGEGTQIQLRKASVKFLKINHIFISHMHGDHMFGLPGVISTFSLLGRKSPLHIYANKDLKTVLGNFLGYFEKNINYDIVYHSLDNEKPEKIFEDDKVEVISFPLKHRVPCCGFLFKEKEIQPQLNMKAVETFDIPVNYRRLIKAGKDFTTPDGEIVPNSKLVIPARTAKKYAFLSDTAYSEKYIDLVKEADLIYHEATFLEEDRKMAKATGHSTAKEAGLFARKCKAKKLIIGHYSTRYKKFSCLLDEAKTEFVNTDEARDLSSFDI